MLLHVGPVVVIGAMCCHACNDAYLINVDQHRKDQFLNMLLASHIEVMQRQDCAAILAYRHRGQGRPHLANAFSTTAP